MSETLLEWRERVRRGWSDDDVAWANEQVQSRVRYMEMLLAAAKARGLPEDEVREAEALIERAKLAAL